MCVECSWGGGGEILTHICVLGIRLEILDCSASGFIKVFTRFLTCNPHSYMLSVESCGFPGGCIPVFPRASPGTRRPPPLANSGALFLIAKSLHPLKPSSVATLRGGGMAWWLLLVASASASVIYPRAEGDGQDAVTGTSGTTQAGRNILASSSSGLIGVVVSQEPFVCWFLLLGRFLVEIWVGYGWRRGVSWLLLRTKHGGVCSFWGAGAGTNPQSLGGCVAASHECWLGLPVFSRGASWLIGIKMRLFWVAIKAGEEVGGCMGLRSILQHLPSQQILPGHPHQHRGTAMGTRAAKIGFLGFFFHVDLHAVMPIWVAWGS